MASKWFVGAIAILAFVLAAVAMATEFAVGDDQGWTINFDYEAWAKDKVFHVGDELVLRSILIHGVFNYTTGWHNVSKVNGTAFTNCTIPPTNEALSTGNEASPAPAPSTPITRAPNSAHGISGSGYHLLMAAMVAIAFLAVWPVFTPEEP
ncbi:Blue copper protein [Vitis vinifera]|uniref:Blue copper protein n=1 Tax=Vitis vinifera TaxID=29760 RepID=A0A438BME7_VITVI|nr:Blue copper protein [Vitis vinifera]